MSWDLIGHDWAVQLLRGHIQKNSLRHAYLITGPDGIGKRTLALRFIQALACPQAGSSAVPCLECPTCQQLERLAHPDLFPIQLEQGSKQIKIDQIRELIHSLSLSPYQASRRFGLLLNFERANHPTQNALLKTLEEPPAPVILVLTAVSSSALLETITSRCEEIRLNPVPLDQARQGLEELHGLPAQQASLLAHISGGKPVLALAYHQDPALLDRRSQLLNEHMDLLRGTSVDRFAYAEKASEHPDEIELVLDIWTSFWHDILLRSGNSRAPLQNIDRQPDLDQVLAKVDLAAAREVVNLFRRTHQLLGENANLRLTLDNLLLQLPAL